MFKNSRHYFPSASTLILLSVLISHVDPVKAQTFTTFSVDPASPAIKESLTPDDVLIEGPTVFIEGNALGLMDDFSGGIFDNLNALSYGRDPIQNPFYFSVDRVAIGLPGTDVNGQAMPEDGEAAADVYRTLPPFPKGTINIDVNEDGMIQEETETFPNGNNHLVIDEEELGLNPGFIGQDGDDLDALDLDTIPNPKFVFFSVDFLSFPHLENQDDILVSERNDETGVYEGFRVYAEGDDIGIEDDDDLDALILWDVTVIDRDAGIFIPKPNGMLDPGFDMALFSLNTFSVSTFTGSGNDYIPGKKGNLSPADVLFTDFETEFEVMPGVTQKFKLWASAPQIGLYPDDELDALDTISVPEPSSKLGLIALSVLGASLTLKRKLN